MESEKEGAAFIIKKEDIMMEIGKMIRFLVKVWNQQFLLGVLYYASGRPAYDGEWVDDKFQGNGILYNDNPKVEDIDYRNLEIIGKYWII